MTEKEKLMYDILLRISNVDAPIVFKGALITKLVLKEQGWEYSYYGQVKPCPFLF